MVFEGLNLINLINIIGYLNVFFVFFLEVYILQLGYRYLTNKELCNML